MDYSLVFIALAAFLGGLLSSVMGWMDSGEPFDPRKFFKSLMAALIAGMSFATIYSFSNGITPKDILLAILGGAGVDGLSNRAIGALTPKK